MIFTIINNKATRIDMNLAQQYSEDERGNTFVIPRTRNYYMQPNFNYMAFLKYSDMWYSSVRRF